MLPADNGGGAGEGGVRGEGGEGRWGRGGAGAIKGHAWKLQAKKKKGKMRTKIRRTAYDCTLLIDA